MRDQHRVQPGHLAGADWELDHHRHIETAQQRIDHHRRAATVDQEPSHTEPAQNGPGARLKRFRTEPLGLGRSSLGWHGWTISPEPGGSASQKVWVTTWVTTGPAWHRLLWTIPDTRRAGSQTWLPISST